MLIKCICTNCAGHLEFEEENAGETIPCPHCGFETVLSLPGTNEVDPEMLGRNRRRALRRLMPAAFAVLLVLGGFGFALYHWAAPWVEENVPLADSTAKAIIFLLIACAILPFLLLWLVFPVLLLFYFRRGTDLLTEIAQSLRTWESEPPEASPDQEPVAFEEESSENENINAAPPE
jgi:hypothetical protein